MPEQEIVRPNGEIPFAGFGDRELFELPKANEDIKQDRYLFTAANLITPDIARDRPHMKDGGLNVYNPCLRHTGDFVRRGRIVPLLTNMHTPIPAEEASSENTAYFDLPAGGDGYQGTGPLTEPGGYKGYPAYPGQQIVHILEGSTIGGAQRILGEISTLKGHKYMLKDMGGFLSDPDLWKIQLAIFPSYPKVPALLSDFTRLIQDAFVNNTDDIRNIAGETLPICQQYESWAIRHIESVHQNMAQAATKGYAHPYDQVDLLILAQLGMRREDEHYKRTAQQAAAEVQKPRALSHEEYVSMKNEIITEWRAEQASQNATTTATAPVDPLSVDKEEMMKIYARDVHRYGVERVRAAAAKGIYGDLHHKTRERIEREVAELFPEDENDKPSE